MSSFLQSSPGQSSLKASLRSRHLLKTSIRSIVAVILIATALAVIPLATPSQAAATLPAGFSLQSIPTPLGGDKSYKLTDIEYVSPAPGVESGLFAAGKDGGVAWVSDDGSSRLLGKVPNVRQVSDNGLVGITPAYDYAKSGRIYVIYNRTGTSHHYGMLSSWLVNSVAHPTAITWERHVIDGSLGSWLDDGPNHQVGDVVAWSDGSLFISQGDGVEPATANTKALWSQDVNDPHGKILRVLPNGNGVPSNPYYDPAQPSSWKSRVYASGVRNGFRLWKDSTSGQLLTSIVGWDSVEMVARVSSGANFGWPCYEGTIKAPGYSAMLQCQSLYKTLNPASYIWTYAHNGEQASVTGGVTYTGSSYPSQYKGKTFVGDFARQEIWTFGTDGQKLTSSPIKFASGIGNNTSVRACQNGDICWTDIINSRIIRLRYGLSNRAPVADIKASVDAATRTVTFDGSESYDPEGDALTYSWNFGDGANGSGAITKHTYATAGTFTATLTVTDGLGNTGSFDATVNTANSAPIITLKTPSQVDFAVGDNVNLSATVTDAEDGQLPASQIEWKVEMQHCPFNKACHPHPSGAATAANFSTVFPDHGGDTRLVFTAKSPADSNGVTTTVTYTAKPRLRNISVVAPADVTATINADQTNSINGVAKAAIAVSVPTTSASGSFQKWSDGVTSPARQLTMPDAPLTLTAIYGGATTSPIAEKYQSMGGSKSWLGEPTGEEFSVGSGRQRDYKWGSLYWTSSTGVHFVKGAIRVKYQELGGPAKYGFPTTDELKTSDGKGAYNNFKDGKAIYWTSSTNAHEVHGGIYKAWIASGAEKGKLGYPTSDEYSISTGRRSNFQKGYITWNKTTGAIQIYYY